MIQTLAAAILMSLGPWYAEVPIDGVTAGNAPELRRTLIEHFGKMTSRGGRHPFALEVEMVDDRVRILVMCDADLRLSDISAALRGSTFRVAPENWQMFGKLSLEWKREDAASAAELAALRATLANLGEVDIVRVDQEAAFRGATPTYHAHIKFPRGQSIAAERILAAFVVHGLERPDILWENYPHMNSRVSCGARRIATAKVRSF